MDKGETYEVKNLSLASQVIQLPGEIDDEIAALQLTAMGIEIDRMTAAGRNVTAI